MKKKERKKEKMYSIRKMKVAKSNYVVNITKSLKIPEWKTKKGDIVKPLNEILHSKTFK